MTIQYLNNNPVVIFVVLIAVPLVILWYEKNKTVKKNKNYGVLLEQLQRQADGKVRQAIEQSGIIPLGDAYAKEFNDNLYLDGDSVLLRLSLPKSLYLDRERDLVMLFAVETKIFDDENTKVPRSPNHIVEKLNQSELMKVGWGLVSRDYAEDFISRLAKLDDALDFELGQDDNVLENKIVFSHTLPFLESQHEVPTQAFTINDGDVTLTSLDPNEDGTLALIIEAKSFFNKYGKNDQISVGNIKVTI
jgi:hypothetical protein